MMSVAASAASVSSVVAVSNCVIDMIVKSSVGFIYIGWTF